LVSSEIASYATDVNGNLCMAPWLGCSSSSAELQNNWLLFGYWLVIMVCFRERN